MLLADLVATSDQVAAAPGRRAKIDAIASLLRQAEPGEVAIAVAFLSGELRQRQIGVGYAALTAMFRMAPAAAPFEPLTLPETDAVFAAVGAAGGTGAAERRRVLLTGLFERAGPAERDFLIRLLGGGLRQGALAGVMAEAVAQAAGVPAAEVRRALLYAGSLQTVAEAALGDGPRIAEADPVPQAGGMPRAGAVDGPAGDGGAAAALAALRAFKLEVGRPLLPMLASAAPTVTAALEKVRPAALEWKIDGARIQVHRDGSEVAVFTRSLDDITARVPEITEAVLALDVRSVVLDGETIALAAGGRPHPFQVTAGRVGSSTDVGQQRLAMPLTAFFFDLLHLDGTDLTDVPAEARHAELARILPPALLIPRLVTGDDAAAERFFADAVARGHEGVVVKSPGAPYASGRRGSEWIKVKPRHTLDLVILAAEWGHGRRRGWLSNLHLGARDPGTNGLVMLGKTFKGLTDQMLTWQTERLLALAEPPGYEPPPDRQQAHGVVRVRPELVVEVAFDGVQGSTRYPGGVALRFARVLRHRPDKPPAEADTIAAVRALWPGAAGTAERGELAGEDLDGY